MSTPATTDPWGHTVYLTREAVVCGQRYGAGNAFEYDALSNTRGTVTIEGDEYPLSWFTLNAPRMRGLAYKTREVTKWVKK